MHGTNDLSEHRQQREADALSEVRALLGEARTRGFGVSERKRAFSFRTGLQRALMSARTSVSGPSVHRFFRTLKTLTRRESTSLLHNRAGHDYLLQLLRGDPLPLHEEIHWLTCRLQSDADTIKSYLSTLQIVESAFASQDHEACIREIEGCEEKLGISLWSTELKLGFLQVSRGLEAQKAELRKIRSISRRGMWPYIAYAASLRAEPSVSIGWYLDETRRRLDRLKPSAFTDYMRYRGLAAWPQRDSACSAILRTEQSHHVIDMYETLLSYIQTATTASLSPEVNHSILSAVDALRFAKDKRLDKLAIVFSVDRDAVTCSSSETIAAALATSRPPSMRRHLRAELRGPITPERAFGLALSAAPKLAPSSRNSHRKIFVRGLAAALQRTGQSFGDEINARDILRKHASIFWNLPVAKSIGLLGTASVSPDFNQAVCDFRIAALNSPSLGALDLIGFSNHPAYERIRALFPDGPVAELGDLFAGKRTSPTKVSAECSSIAQATYLLGSGKADNALSALAPALRSTNRVLAAQAASLALNCCARLGDVDTASTLLATEHVFMGVDPEAMPVRRIYDSSQWQDLRDAAKAPDLSIALSMIQSQEGDDRLKTYRRFALETLLNSYGVQKPSELRTVSTPWDPRILSYFLDKVCTTAMLDMLPAIHSSREVLEERREICGYLTVVDKGSNDRLGDEILGLSRELTVIDGLQTIDGSRVHVDTESLSKALKVDLGESFQRYLSLKGKEDGGAEAIGTLLKDIASREQPPEYLLAIPVSERDTLLVSMIRRARERFLFDVPHGLDSYLSKRIRHGSIVGVLRSPAEREAVLAKRGLDGTYRHSGTWADRVADASQRAALAAAIISLSKSVDQQLTRIKDVLLHVRSETKPLGLFDAVLTPPAYLIIRSYVNADATLDSFIETMFRSLWGMIGSSLAEAQTLLRKQSVVFVSEQFQSLRAKAQKILKVPEERAEFDAAAARASVGMQTALITAASWFEPAESKPRMYSLDEVIDIAVASVRATTPEFRPDLKITGDVTVDFSDLSLPTVGDLLYIAFGNVAAHARNPSTPCIWIDISKGAAQNSLVFRIRNEVPASALTSLPAKLELIRQDLRASKGITRARSEGGSGLHKLATFVTDSANEALDFGIVDDKFQLQLEFSYSPDRPF